MEIFAKQDLFQPIREDKEGEEKLDDIRERIEGLELALAQEKEEPVTRDRGGEEGKREGAQEKEDKIEETTQEALEKKHS